MESLLNKLLLLPGNHLDMSTLLDKMFGGYKNGEGALAGFSVLQKDGLGTLENASKRGVHALAAEIIDFETHTVVNRFARKRYQKSRILCVTNYFSKLVLTCTISEIFKILPSLATLVLHKNFLETSPRW